MNRTFEVITYLDNSIESSFKNKKKIPKQIKLLIFLTPFCYPFRPIIGEYIHLHVYIVMYITIFLLCIISLLKNNSICATKEMVLIAVLYIVMVTVSPDIDTGIKWIANLACGMILANLMDYYEFRAKDAFIYVIGAITCGIVMLPDIVARLPVSLVYCYDVRIPFMDGDISIGPNSWAFTLGICFLFAGIIFTNGGGTIRVRLLTILVIAMIGWQLLLTSSRTSVYALVVCICTATFRWSMKKSKSILLKVFHIVLVFCILTGVVLLMVSPTFIFSGNSRLTTFDFNGRMSIWTISIDTFCNMNPMQWLFGCGTGGASVYNYQKLLEYYGAVGLEGMDHISTHNIYLDMLISTGIIGTALVLYYLIKAMITMYRDGSLEFVFPMFVLMAGLSANLLASWDFCIIIAVIEYYYLRRKQNDVTIRIRYRQ